MRGTYQVRALDSPVSLGALPLDLARPAIVTALQELARSDRYEAWLLARERVLERAGGLPPRRPARGRRRRAH